MENLISNSAVVLLAVAVICTLICVITEFTKEIGILNKIPTDLQVLILSIIVCYVCFFAYISYKAIKVQWYYLAAVLFISFIIAIICTKGWNYLINIFKRFYKADLKK